MPQNDRYSRQKKVNKIRVSGQQKISQTSVLIVGVGGLGCHVASQLAGAGIGTITVVDHDVVSLSNLHRQILFREKDVGKPKAKIATRELSAINSDIKVKHHNGRINLSNLNELAKDANFIIDAADNFITSFILSDYCSAHNISLLSASVNQTFGWVGIFCGAQEKTAPSLRDVFTQLSQHQQSCDTVGVTGSSVAIIAGIQTQEALKLALKDDASLLGKLLYVDLWNYQQHIIDFSDADRKGENINLLNKDDISTNDLIVDVREHDEQHEKPLSFENVRSLPLSEIKTNGITKLPSSKRLVFACISGQRALIAAQTINKQGFHNVAVLIPE